MADTTFVVPSPDLKAVDTGDTPTVYAISIAHVNVPAGGTDTVFTDSDPALKAIDLGDGTYAISVVYQT